MYFGLFLFVSGSFFPFTFFLFLPSAHHDNNLALGCFCREVGNHFLQRSTHALLMDLRDFPADADLSVCAEHLRKLLERFQQSVGRLIEDHGACLLLQRRQLCLAAFLLCQESFGMQAVAPGSVCTSIPAATASRTRKNPGSLMPGVPASLIRAMVCPALSLSTIAADVPCSLYLWWDIRWFCIWKCFRSIPDVRVSSARMRSASLRIRMARSVMSSRFPTGVGTI